MTTGEWLRTVAAPGIAVEALPPRLRSTVSSEIAGAWLAAALMHKSWLYENPQTANVNGALLSALGGVGQSALELEILSYLQMIEPDAPLQRRHEALAYLHPILRHLVDVLELPHYARLGKGEESERQQRPIGRRQGTLPTIAAQVLGWWSLFGAPDQLGRLVAEALETLASDSSSLLSVDSKTIVQNRFAKLRPTYTVSGAGPDHERTFDARLSLADGRSATGSGRSKKLAEKAAALALVLAHAPDAMPSRGTASDAGDVRRAAQEIGREDAELYADVATMFGCRRRENFALAMTHRSWTYEYSQHLHLEGGSNALLALNGRHVFDLMFRRLRLLRLLQSNAEPTQEQAALIGITDAEMATILDELGLRQRVRMGLGQRALGASSDIAADCVQALFGAAFIEHRDIAALEKAVPPAISARLNAAAPLVTFDPVTTLNRLAAELNFAVTEVASVFYGNQHNRTYESTLALKHRGFEVQVRGQHSSRRGARQDAASEVIAATAALNGEGAPDHDQDLVAIMLRAQISQLGQAQHWTRWVAEGRLGACHLASGDAPRYEAWAAASSAATDGWHPDAEQSANLAAYLRFAAGGGHRAKFSAVLESTLDALDGLTAHELAPEDELTAIRSAVAALTAAHGVHLADRSGGSLAELIDEWLLVSRRLVSASVDGDGSMCLGPRAASATTRVLHELTLALDGVPGSGPVDISVRLDAASAHGGTVTIQGGRQWTEALSGSAVLPLVLESAPGCTVQVLGSDTVALCVSDTAGRNWLTTPLLNPYDDAYEHELARLLHDLKNELTATTTAMRPQPNASRSERLTRQLTASRHLDSVAGLTVRLRAAGAGISQHTEDGVVELDPFLRGYCADLMRSLPADVHVLPPEAPTSATVAVTSRALRVILDNLTKNAVEAMPDGGRIRLDAIATDTEVMLEVADSGAGVPEAVLQALRAGQLAGSTKHTGSGLGLASVQRLLRPLGGRLDWTSGAQGHTWLVLLPSRQPEGSKP